MQMWRHDAFNCTSCKVRERKPTREAAYSRSVSLITCFHQAPCFGSPTVLSSHRLQVSMLSCSKIPSLHALLRSTTGDHQLRLPQEPLQVVGRLQYPASTAPATMQCCTTLSDCCVHVEGVGTNMHSTVVLQAIPAHISNCHTQARAKAHCKLKLTLLMTWSQYLPFITCQSWQGHV
jgi:hypothetical protein